MCYLFVTKSRMNLRTLIPMLVNRYRLVTESEKFRRRLCISVNSMTMGMKVWIVVMALAGAMLVPAETVTDNTHIPLHIGLTATFPNDQYRALEDWRRYLERRLKRPITFVRRDKYIEMMDLLRLQKIDFAWICDYPFVLFENQTRLLAVPLHHGRPYYQSYLIVSAQDKKTASILDLKNMVFAYSDPYSNTGYLTPRFDLRKMDEDPSHFFRKTFFTWSHSKTVEAVATGLAQGGSVSSHVWDTLAKVKPELTAATRIVTVSPDYGQAPFVSRTAINEAAFRDMQQVLLTMREDADGQRLLRALNLDGFTVGDRHLFDRVAQMLRTFGGEP